MQTFYFINLRICIIMCNSALVGINVYHAEFYKNLHTLFRGMRSDKILGFKLKTNIEYLLQSLMLYCERSMSYGLDSYHKVQCLSAKNSINRVTVINSKKTKC